MDTIYSLLEEFAKDSNKETVDAANIDMGKVKDATKGLELPVKITNIKDDCIYLEGDNGNTSTLTDNRLSEFITITVTFIGAKIHLI